MRISDEDLSWVISWSEKWYTISASDVLDVALDLRDLRSAIRKHMEDLGAVGRKDANVDAELYAHLEAPRPAPVGEDGGRALNSEEDKA